VANDHLLEKQMLSSRDSCGHPLEAIVLPRVYGAAFKDTLFDCQSTQSNSPYPIGKQESGRTFCVGWERHCSWSLRLSQTYESLEISRLEYATHFGSEPNGRLEEPWRSAPCKVWKARFDQMDHFRVTRHVFTSPRCFCPHLKSLQIS